ncbi:hypothetical protein [Rhodohalobacter halophilus]|uniref:hypothetical protein n=1 Tax=Rhodohalobacter halophilus TaxID=1812810 RepID=UPI00083FCA41|nr:hypothetical protein [Rhodohalobacter halophilus]
MEESRKNKLLAKRERNKKLREITEYCQDHVIPWLDVYLPLKRDGAVLEVESLAVTFGNERKLFEEALMALLPDDEQSLLSDVTEAATLPIHQKMEDYFPSRQSLRYFPEGGSLKSITSDLSNILDAAVTRLDISEADKCLVCYPIYTPVLSMSFQEIRNHADILLNPSECIALIHEEFDWMIFRSLEDEWVWARNSN